MSYFFLGGEDLDFSPIGNASIITSAGWYRSGFARCALSSGPWIFGGGNGWRVPASYGLEVTGTFWLTARLSYTGTSYYNPVVTFNGPGDVPALQIAGAYLTGSLLIYAAPTAGAAPVEVATGTGSLGGGALVKLDVVCNFSTTGSVSVYVNGDLVASYSGNVTGGQPYFAGFDMSSNAFSECIWADHDTRPLGLVTLAPTANGATNTWDVQNVSNIDEITINDAKSDQSGSAGEIDLYAVNGLPPSNYGIDAVEVVARAATTAGAPQNLQLMVRAGGTDYNSPSFLQGAAFQRNAYQWAQNPNTATYWLQGDLGTGFNVGMESEP